jgi:hypothetical protein
MMTAEEWEIAEKRDPTKTYVEPLILPSYKWSMRIGGACFIAIPIVAIGLMATVFADMPHGEHKPALSVTFFCQTR